MNFACYQRTRLRLQQCETLGPQELPFLDMVAGGAHPNGTRIVHNGTDQMIVQQNTIPDLEITSPIRERS